MPIINYEQRAERELWRLLNDTEISATNKELLQKFLAIYEVTPARRAIFLERMRPLLRAAPEVAKTVRDREAMNALFHQLRQRYRPSTYATLLNVSLRFARWVTGQRRPSGFKDLKPPARKDSKRQLDPHDMISWEEGLALAGATQDVQMKAIVLTQLDAGLRPSEFVDLLYGDVAVRNQLILIYVRRGKTGSRTVILHRAVPHFLPWYQAHPTKAKNDPLWVADRALRPGAQVVRRYQYAAMCKRVRLMGRRIGLDKPLDFYNLRHSSCALDKIDNLPLDLAADRHGHSVKHFTEVYGRLNIDEISNRFLKHYGKAEITSDRLDNLICPRCAWMNKPDDTCCSRCAAPLTLREALAWANAEPPDSRLGELTSQLDQETARRKELERTLAQQHEQMEERFNRMKEQLLEVAIREIHEKLRKAAS